MSNANNQAPISLDSKFGGSGMTVGEAVTRFKQAKDRREILQILSDESGLTVETVKATFIAAGTDYKLFPRAKRKPDVPEVKPEDQKKFQAERERPKPPGKALPKDDGMVNPDAENKNPAILYITQLLNKRDKVQKELDEIKKQLNQIADLLYR